jgi:hypothetical protein
MAERMAEKTAVIVATEHTFEKIAELWLKHWQGNKSARHSATTGNRLKGNVYPILGSREVALHFFSSSTTSTGSGTGFFGPAVFVSPSTLCQIEWVTLIMLSSKRMSRQRRAISSPRLSPVEPARSTKKALTLAQMTQKALELCRAM